jgi:alpha-beta hydrolase superfamily lysophospholipase
MAEHRSEYLHSEDGTRLHVQSWLPAGGVRAGVAIVHGWSDHGGRYGNVVEHLLPHGYAVYALDLRGHGLSDGQRGHIGAWDEYRQDVHTLVTRLEREQSGAPLFLMGHSMGGLTVMEYAIHHPTRRLNGLVASSPLLAEPNVPGVLKLAGRVLSRVAPSFSLNPGADAATISRDPAVVAAYERDPLVHARATPRFSTEMSAAQEFVLLLYGSDDQLVPPHVSRAMFAQVGAADKTRHEYDGGYHELFNDFVKAQMLEDLLTWLDAHKQQ